MSRVTISDTYVKDNFVISFFCNPGLNRDHEVSEEDRFIDHRRNQLESDYEYSPGQKAEHLAKVIWAHTRLTQKLPELLVFPKEPNLLPSAWSKMYDDAHIEILHEVRRNALCKDIGLDYAISSFNRCHGFFVINDTSKPGLPVVGFTVVSFNNDSIKVHLICTLQKYKGVGAFLINFLKTITKKYLDLNYIRLDAVTSAVEFYLKYGYECGGHGCQMELRVPGSANPEYADPTKPARASRKLYRERVSKTMKLHRSKIDARDRDRNIEFFIDACRHGNLKRVKRFVEDGIPIDSQTASKRNYTGLFIAAIYNHLSVVQFLTENGADINRIIKNEKNQDTNAMTAAIIRDHSTVVMYLLENGGETVYKKSSFLSILCLNQARKTLKLVLETEQFDPNDGAEDGATPVYATVFSPIGTNDEKIEILEMLTEYGAIIDNNTYRAKVKADRPNVSSKLLLYLESQLDESIFEACEEGHIKKVENIIANSRELINSRNQEHRGKDRTPLHVAAIFGQVRIVELLISAGSDLNDVDVDGNTALHLAIIHKRNPIIYILAGDRRSNLELVNKQGETPLITAVKTGLKELVSIVAPNSKINQQTRIGTALSVAQKGNLQSIVAYLKQRGAK